ncbi:MAG: ribokinase, partial [Chloroflexota bacterium]
MRARPRVAVVGSFVTDLVIRAPRRPRPGETLIGHSLDIFLGGKGFNQAVAAARLGAEVTMIGRVGNDAFGDRFLEALNREGIHADYVIRDPQQGTGVASPLVEDSGENSIVQVPRANAALSPAD